MFRCNAIFDGHGNHSSACKMHAVWSKLGWHADVPQAAMEKNNRGYCDLRIVVGWGKAMRNQLQTIFYMVDIRSGVLE